MAVEKGRAAVAGNKSIADTLFGAGKSGQAVLAAQLGKTGTATGEQLVCVALMPYVEQDLVPGQGQHTVQGHGQFHHAQIGRKVSAGGGNTVDQKITDVGT